MENQELRDTLIKMMCVGDEIEVITRHSLMFKSPIMSLPFIYYNEKEYVRLKGAYIETEHIFEYRGKLYIFLSLATSTRDDRYEKLVERIKEYNGEFRT